MQAVSESDPLNSDFACAAYWLYTRSLWNGHSDSNETIYFVIFLSLNEWHVGKLFSIFRYDIWPTQPLLFNVFIKILPYLMVLKELNEIKHIKDLEKHIQV